MVSKRRLAACMVLVALVSACSLPRGAAMEKEILRDAESKSPNFVHYSVDSALLSDISQWPASKGAGQRMAWVSGGGNRSGQILAVGDLVQLSVWEGGENKLLTSPEVPASQIPATPISASGNIFVPYVGLVKVSGLSVEAAREKVQEAVTVLIPEAQVQLFATPGKTNSVALVGGVMRPGTVPLADRSLTVLGLISEGGGALPSIENPQLRLQRGGHVYEISMRRVLADPSLDAGLRPGDKLSVEKDSRSFLALGASRLQKMILFPKDHVSALEAVTLAGGIDDSRADPKGVLILREYPATAVSTDVTRGPSQTRVVFSMDLTTTEGLFSAQNFEIAPNDLVLATESPAVSTRTFLGLFNSTVGIARNTRLLTE